MDLPNGVQSMDQSSVSVEIQTNNGNIPSSPMEPQNIEPCEPDELSCPEGTLDISSESQRSVITDEIRTEVNELPPLEHVSRKHISGPLLDDSSRDRTKNINSEKVNRTSKVRRKNKRIAVLESDSDSEPEEPARTQRIEEDTRLVKDIDASEFDNSDAKSNSPGANEGESSKQKYSLTEEEPTQLTSGKSAKSRLQRQFEKDLENFPKKVTTVKDAAEQRKQIQSESQRMLRERNISLPYHKPKTRSLQEFLSRRPKLSRALPGQAQRTAPSIAIKMTNDQLELISIQLKEREKEVKEFYKSESESDNEESEPVEENDIATDDEQNPASNEATAENSESAIQEDLAQVQENNGADLQTSNNESAPEASTEPISHTEAQLRTEEQPNNLLVNEPPQQDQSYATMSESNSIQAQKRTTETYDFNLDSSIEDPNTSTEVELGKPNSSGSEKAATGRDFTFTEIDREIENFGNSSEAIDEELAPPCPPKSALELLKEKLANDTPQLSGKPDDLIDLDSVTKPNQLVELMERFAKHVSSTKKHHNQHKVKLSIVSVESGGDIHKEEVAVNVDSDEEDLVLEEKPGAKLHKLKVNLQNQMQQKKAELWQQKAAKGLRAGALTSEEGEENEGDVLDDDDEEAEMTDEEETDEELEDDVDMSEKARKKSDFLDEEADVTDDEEDVESVKEGFEYNAEEDDEEAASELEASEDIHEPEQKKVLKRILKPTDSDSEEEDLFNDSVAQKSLSNVQLDSTITADEDDIPSHQPPQVETPAKAAGSQGKSITDFLTPISFVTSIQNLASVPKSNKKEGFMSPFKMPPDLQDERSVKQKKLFSDSDMLDSEGSLNTQEFRLNVQVPSAEELPTTQNLLNICSGQFTGIPSAESKESTGKVDQFKETQSGELKSLDQEDTVISQLLDEEELELFKKKFDSPETPAGTVPENKEVSGGGVIDSDDDDETVGAGPKKRKNQKIIQFSDDDSSEDDLNEDEEIDLQDNVESDNEQDVAYDSEENEIEIGKAEKPQKINLKDFVEAEAELSESEWGSEDEDEKDMDNLEFELGDTETFDEEQVKSDLEKIHMRRMLDDDTREVKLLQELLLEDGEMHGTGRQRQFKWKNIDLADEQVENKQDDDIFFDEEESEEQWRKKRHEREMFLKQHQQKNMAVDDLLGNSQLLQIGQRILQKSQNSQNTTPAEKNKADKSPFKNTPFNIQNKRGSFLNRTDQVLHRVAEFTKVVTEVGIHSKKTTKHFLFQSVSVDGSSSSTTGQKRKAAEATPRLLKKLRLNTDLSPAVKKLDKPERSRKLFNF